MEEKSRISFCPSEAKEGGTFKKGLPIGLRIMGPQFGESTLLKVAHTYEQATEWKGGAGVSVGPPARGRVL